MRAIVAVFFLIFAAVPSGACCAWQPSETAVVDHSRHHGAPDGRAPADHHPAPAFVCVAFCAATPVAATMTAPRVGPAIEAEPPAGPEPEGFEGQPAPPPPRLV